MGRPLTDADFNADSREIRMKVELYLDGENELPLTVTRDDALISCEILEETGADISWPLGTVSANELYLQLYNDNGVFSPTNADGPYYGKIDTGIKVIPYITVELIGEEVDWLQLGVFYVADWYATITGKVATINATDMLQEFFSADKLNIPIEKDLTYKEFYENIFQMYGNITPIVSSYFDTETIPWSYMERTNAELLQQAVSATIGICLCNRAGVPEIKHLSETAANLRVTLTDNNQVFSADSRQSVTKQYKNSILYYSKPQISEERPILTFTELVAEPGTHKHEDTAFSATNVYQITNIMVQGDRKVRLSNYTATPRTIVLETENLRSVSSTAKITVTGRVLEHIEQIMESDTEGVKTNILEFSNNFVQTREHAAALKQALDNMINSLVPELTVAIKGNPLLRPGDKVTIQSDQYKLNYNGIIKRISHMYTGSLNGQIELLDAAIFGL